MRILLLTLVLIISSAAQSQYLVSAEFLGSLSQEELDIIPLISPDYGVDSYKIIYNTTDALGEPTIASGMLSIPATDECYGFPIAVYMHGTTLNKENVPSRDNDEAAIGKFIGGLGYFACAPDYVGMGDSPGLHPYVHGASEATAGVDMVRAAREHLATLGQVDNGELFITGYSQGGHAAMAMHKHIEDNDMLDEMNVIASAPGSGPYNLSGSQLDVILSGEPYTNPGYLVYVMASYDLAYDNLYDSYSDILQDPYAGIVPPFFDGNNTTMSMGALNGQLTPVVEDLLQADLIADIQSDMNHPLRLDLQDNDNFDWTPTRPINMLYCSMDEQVNFSNSEDAQAAFEANGSTVTQANNLGPLDHGNCFLPAMLGAINYFGNLRTDCVLGLDEFNIDFAVYPNPTIEEITITTDEQMIGLRIYDSAGKLVLSDSWTQAPYRTEVSSLSPGLYHIEALSAEGDRGSKPFIKN